MSTWDSALVHFGNLHHTCAVTRNPQILRFSPPLNPQIPRLPRGYMSHNLRASLSSWNTSYLQHIPVGMKLLAGGDDCHIGTAAAEGELMPCISRSRLPASCIDEKRQCSQIRVCMLNALTLPATSGLHFRRCRHTSTQAQP